MGHTQNNPEPLEVESSLDLLLVLLYTPGETGELGEPINGITRFQKLVFLIKQKEGPQAIVASAKEFLYQPYKMGPFSKQLYKDIELLISLGLVKTTKLEYFITDDGDTDADGEHEFPSEETSETTIESTKYELTDRGMEAGRDLFAGLKKKDREALVEFKTFFNSIPLRQLLIFVYQKYPEFTTESEIRGQLGM